jgi:hypothetical protein
VSKDVTPDLSVLNGALTVPLAQLKGTLTSAVPGLTLKGLLEEQVTAKADGSASGDASVAGLGLDLGTLTGGATDALASLSLELGALTAHAEQAANPNGAQLGSCTVAGLGLDLTSPLLAGLVTSLTTALAGLDSLTSVLQSLLTSLGVITVTGIPTVSSIVAAAGQVNAPDGSISIDLATGSVHLDVAKLLAAAGLDFCATPNTNVVEALGDALANSVPQLISDVVDGVLHNALGALSLCTGPEQPNEKCLRIKVAGSDVTSTAAGLLGSTLPDLVTSLTSAVGDVLKPVGGLVSQLGSALSGIIDITTNKQTTTDGTFSETALEVTLLSGTAGGSPLVRLDLSNATVGPQSVLAPPSSSSAPPIKVNAGRPGGADGGFPLLWLGVVLLVGGVGGVAALRLKAARHS